MSIMPRFLARPLLGLLLALTGLLAAVPAQAAVTITFWSHELGNSFPHAFITLRGVPDAGGAPVDGSYGFTAKSVTPALLFGTVAGTVEDVKPTYMAGSDAQFSVILTDAQYAQELALIAAWSEKTGDARYSLKTRNCIHFAKEAARIAGLTGLDQPGLMKRPRSYLRAVAAENEGRIVPVGLHGKEYLATLAPLPTTPPVALPADPVPPAPVVTSAPQPVLQPAS